MSENKFILILSLVGFLALLPAGPLHAQSIERSMCVFDIVGTNGPVFNAMEQFKTTVLNWGVKLKLLPYTDEVVALEDFRAGQCDGIVLTGVRNRQLVKFAGSLDMMGAVPSYEHLKKVLKVLSRPKADKLLQNKKFETVGILPAGAVYLFVHPEAMKTYDGTPSIEDLAGLKIAALRYDQQQIAMIRHVGGSVVAADIANFGGMFNNGLVDMMPAPPGAYQALELYKGLGDKGRIVDFPVAHMTYQMTVRKKQFPDTFGLRLRQYAVEQFDEAKRELLKARNDIPDKYWLEIPDENIGKYRRMFYEVRQKLRKKKVYDPRMMQLLRNVRCSLDPTLAECTMAQSN